MDYSQRGGFASSNSYSNLTGDTSSSEAFHLVPVNRATPATESIAAGGLLNSTPLGNNGTLATEANPFESSNLLPSSRSSSAGKLPSSASPFARWENTEAPPAKWFRAGGNALFWKTWAYESLLVLCAAGIMIAIATILKLYQDEPQPSWQLGINLNTVIALLATLLRSTIVMVVVEVISQAKWLWQRNPQPVRHLDHFDNASRGPLGSIMLSFRMPKLFLSRHASSALLGCIITVLSLAIGTFTQQAIKPVVCHRPVVGVNASFPVVSRYASLERLRTGAGTWDLGSSIKGTMVNAFAGSYKSPALLQDCKTGNCTFAETDGVTHRVNGFCSKCIDTTKLLKFNVTDQTVSLPVNMTVDPRPRSATGWFETRVSSIGARYNQEKTFDWASAAVDDEMRDLLDKECTVLAADIVSLTISGCDLNSTVGTYQCTQQTWGTGYSDPGDPPTWHSVSATCALYPCVKDMRAAVKEGILTETPVRTAPMTGHGHENPLSDDYVLADLPCTVGGNMYDIHNISLVNITGYNHMGTFINGEMVQLPYECGYSFDSVTAAALRQHWSRMVHGSCGGDWASGRGDETRRFPQCLSGKSDTWWHAGLFNGGNATFESISERMEVVALAITDAFRKPTADDDMVKGVVWESKICTRFDWPWLLYPAVLVFLTVVSLAAIIWVTASDNEKAPVWKSSILPLLYGEKLGSLKELERRAEKDTAVLEQTSFSGDGKWQIVLRGGADHQGVEAAV